MKHPTKKDKAKVRKFCNDLMWFFGIQGYEKNLVFKEKSAANENAAADVSVAEDYQRITINIYPTFWNCDEKEQRQILLHEHCHIFIQPVQHVATEMLEGRLQTREYLREAVEKSTCKVEYAIERILENRADYLKKGYNEYLGKPKPKVTKKKRLKKRKSR